MGNGVLKGAERKKGRWRQPKTLSPFVSFGLGVLSHENTGLILSQITGGGD